MLCVECGYHTKLQRHLATSVEKEPSPAHSVDENPYASPQVDEARAKSAGQKQGEGTLPAAVVKQVEAVIRAAGTVPAALFLVCVCVPLWFAILPWYAYQLWSWFQLQDMYEELRIPNSFSPHAQLALNFQDSRRQLISGVVVGLILCGLMALAFVLNRLRLIG